MLLHVYFVVQKRAGRTSQKLGLRWHLILRYHSRSCCIRISRIGSCMFLLPGHCDDQADTRTIAKISQQLIGCWIRKRPSVSGVLTSKWEKAMATLSSTLAWKIPWTEEPCRLQSMGLLRVGYDWVTSLSLFTFIHWRRKWQPASVFLPGESQGWGSLVGCRLWGLSESDTTEAT